MSRPVLIFALLALTSISGAAAARTEGNVERYVELRQLLDRGFSCTRAVRRGGPMPPGVWSLRNEWLDQLDRVRAALVRIEGEERVVAAEQSLGLDVDVHFTGPCSVTAADRSRAQFRRRLRSLQAQLGLPREPQQKRLD